MLQGGDTSAGQLPENIGKNRYRDVLPYEVSKCWLINIAGIDSVNNTLYRRLEYNSTRLTTALAMTTSMQALLT